MNKKIKEPFLAARVLNFVLGIVILSLAAIVMIKREDTVIYEALLFTLAAIENFIGATISFSEHKKVRGNIYAVICAVFFIIALLLAVRAFGIL